MLRARSASALYTRSDSPFEVAARRGWRGIELPRPPLLHHRGHPVHDRVRDLVLGALDLGALSGPDERYAVEIASEAGAGLPHLVRDHEVAALRGELLARVLDERLGLGREADEDRPPSRPGEALAPRGEDVGGPPGGQGLLLVRLL